MEVIVGAVLVGLMLWMWLLYLVLDDIIRRDANKWSEK